jgi:cation diffusion facilitator CzcD-associated flavoprotein CzcO
VAPGSPVYIRPIAVADPPQHEAIVVGAGFSGIGVAIGLVRAGVDVLVLEDGDGVGGAWHWNTYPGVAVDIPSFSYQFSFAQRHDWSRTYAPGRELKNYADWCVDAHGAALAHPLTHAGDDRGLRRASRPLDAHDGRRR